MRFHVSPLLLPIPSAFLALLLLALAPVANAQLPATHAQSAPCGGPFDAWLAEFRDEAIAKGISSQTLSKAAPLMKVDPAVLAKDRGQQVFAQTFVEFAGRMAEGYRLPQGKERIRKNADTFERIERQFGVPAAVIVAFWALETDFGANMGDVPTIRALTTLAHDCRRPQLFREQLLAALRILQNGDLTLEQMKGPFAGELGQLQFLPTHYFDHAVDFDGDGRRNLIGSTPDALASAANYAASLGWRRGEPWLEEVRVPADLPWEESGLDIEHPRSRWSGWGVTRADGGRLPSDGLPASLLLPMGRHGPAFLAYPNFRIYLQWNQSLVYATTAAYLATRIARAPRMDTSRKVPSLSVDQMRALQQELKRRGYDVGKIDGVLGAQTRIAVRDVQKKLGMPADAYPTTELFQRLRSE
ncbi:MAG TPA: lytic murein transglycosylase [Candidatus Limnocylindrales bacterium]|nr:lytic murein transglycosylase [Candidatus Limnocylindrales bacterium]